jgi:DNA-binding Lrp family transcriptional regulator
MPSAFVLINVGASSEDNVLTQIKGVGGVKEAYVSYGMYDLIVKITTETMDELKTIVSRKIRSLDKVLWTSSLIIVEE